MRVLRFKKLIGIRGIRRGHKLARIARKPARLEVLRIWRASLRRGSDFVVDIARKAPELILLVRGRQVTEIYDLLGETLALELSPRHREHAANALMRSVLEVPGRVPESARKVIRAREKQLQRFPRVWGSIAQFAAG